MFWKEVSWIVQAADRALLEDHLEALGAVAISVHNATQVPSFESEPGKDPDWQQVRVVALFGESTETAGILHAIESALGHRFTGGKARQIEDRDWVGEWARSLHPQCFADRLWIVPQGLAVPPQAQCVVRLDPGMAFGSGTHETTQLCLEWLARQQLAGCRVVDYGCGSGVLGIAALRLGARGVLAVDIDPQAIDATTQNAIANDVSENLQVGLPAEMPSEAAEIVLANILLRALVDNADVLARYVVPGGQLVLSGVLRSQVELLIPAFENNFEEFEVQTRNEWACVVARRRLPLEA